MRGVPAASKRPTRVLLGCVVVHNHHVRSYQNRYRERSGRKQHLAMEQGDGRNGQECNQGRSGNAVTITRLLLLDTQEYHKNTHGDEDGKELHHH